MLKELLTLSESTAAVSREMQQNIDKTKRALEKGLASWFEQKEKVEVEVLSENSAKFTIEFNHWLRPETILDVHRTAEDIVRAAKISGELFSVKIDGTGEYAVEALLSGLRRGMPVKAEAFFPDVWITVVWKNIVSRNKR